MTRTTSTCRRRSATAPAATAVFVTAALLLAGCSGGESSGGDSASTTRVADTSAHSHPAPSPAEVSAAQPRLVVTYDGGILTVDAATLEVIADDTIDGFNRVNPVGDGRHVLVSTSEGFQLLDVGVWTEPHGDHGHSYAAAPVLTDTVFTAKKPGHVVRHDGKLILFSDGDGRIQIFDSVDFRDISGGQGDDVPVPGVVETDSPHHGVAIVMADGTVVHTEGTEEKRDTVVAVDADGEKLASSTSCPGVHGEAAAHGEAAVFGCEDGLLIYKGGDFTKVQAEEPYARTGNQAGSEVSPVVLGDYKTDPDAELERPTRITLTDTRSMSTRVVDLGTSYSFRSLGRGPAGEALVLGTDGRLHVVDPDSGEETAAWPVVAEWTEPMEWQEARPTLFVQGNRAYVTEPSTKELHVVDLASGEVLTSAELPETPNELTGVTG